MLKFLFSLFVGLFLLVVPATGMAYTISEAQLSQLEKNMMQLQELTSNSQRTLANSDKLIIDLEQRLSRANEMLDKSEKTIIRLQETITKQQQLLEEANKSFDKFAKESKAEIKKAKMERNLAYIGVVASLFIKR